MTLKYIKEYVDEIVTVSDYELMEAFLLLAEKHKIVGENCRTFIRCGVKETERKRQKGSIYIKRREHRCIDYRFHD